jgi:phosphatidylglycerol lysyltransferase
MHTLLRKLSTVPLGRYARFIPACFLVGFALCGVLMGILVKPWAPTYLLGLGRMGGIAIWLLLLLVARALARGKRHAWLLSVGLLSLLGAFSFENRGVRVLFPFILAVSVAFIALAPLFRTRSDPRALLRGYASLVVGSAALVSHRAMYGLLRPAIPQPYSLLFLIRFAAFLFLGIGVIEILRPVLPRHVHSSAEPERARSVVKRYGCHSLAHYTLGPNMSYFWADSGQAFLAYRICQGVAVMLGDPIGREEELAALVQRFCMFCRRLDWDFAIYQASPATLTYLDSEGVYAIKVGEEAIIDTTTFTLQGRVGAPVRHAIARARRDNVTVTIWHGETIPELVCAGMRQVSTAWLHAQHTYTQMGFSMGRFPADWSPELLTAVALSRNGAVLAFLTWTPLYRGNGWTLDNMRRVEQTPPGTMEYLIAESVEWARVRGFRSMSLSLAPMAGLREEVREINELAAPRWRSSSSARLLQRSAAYLHRRGLLLGNYRSLFAFKNKFQPTWQPRYLVLTDASALPRVLIALAVVHGMGWHAAIRDLRAKALVLPSRWLHHKSLNPTPS